MVDTLEEDGEVDASPFHGSAEAIVDFRDIAVADGLAVVRVDHAVAVEVHVADIARLRVEERLVGVCVDFSLVLEETVRDIAERLPISLARAVEVRIFISGLVAVDEHVSRESIGSLAGQHHFADPVVIIDREVEAGVVHLTHVHIGSDGDTGEIRKRLAAEEDAGAVLLEDIGLDLEFAEEGEIDTDVSLLGHFPAHVRVGDVSFLDTGVALDARTEVGGAGTGDRAEVDETAVTADLVITDQTPGAAHLEHVHDVLHAPPPRLLGNEVTQGDGREEAETLARREVLGTVVTGVEFEKVTIVIVIGQTSGDTLVSVREGVLGRSGAVAEQAAARLLEEEEARYVMTAERTGIVEGSLDIEPTVTGTALPVIQGLAAGLGLFENKVAFLVTTGSIEAVVGAGVVEPMGIISVEGDLCIGLQALSEPAEVMGQADKRLGVVVEGLTITGLGHHRVRVHRHTGRLAGGILLGEENARHQEGILEDLVRLGARLVALLEDGGEVEIQGRVLLHLDIDIGAEIILRITHLRAIFHGRILLVKAALTVVTSTDIILYCAVTARDLHVGAVAGGHRLEDLVHPVHVRIEVGIDTAEMLLHDLGRVILIARGIVHHLHVLQAAADFGNLGGGNGAHFIFGRHLGLGLSTGVSRNEDHTVSTTDTVDGRCRCILENGELLDVVRVHEVDGTLDAIDKAERRVAARE